MAGGTEPDKIALVEDDPYQVAVLEEWLGEAGWKVVSFLSGKGLRQAMQNEVFDLVLLDWQLPDTNGLELLIWLRQRDSGPLPVVFLTARGGDEDICRALEAGADDFIVKPPSRPVTIARIRAVLRRYGADTADQVIDAPPFVVDRTNRTIRRNNVAIQLTDREFDMGAYLFSRINQLVPRGVLLREVWGITADINTRTVDTHASRLRRKLELEAAGWRLSSVYQSGYRLERTDG